MQLPSTWILICFGIILGCFSAVFLLDNWRSAAISIFLYFMGRYSKLFCPILAGFILGISIAIGHYFVFYQLKIPEMWQSQLVTASGKVIEVDNSVIGEALKVKLEQVDGYQFARWRTVNAKLYRNSSTPMLRVGDHIEFTVKLKRYRSRINIGLFNAELHAFRKHIYFKGSIKTIKSVVKDTTWRDNYRLFIDKTLDGRSYAWLYYILLTGDTSKVDFENKTQFRSLGLSHLLAISGLHIGMVFAIAFLLIKVVLYCIPVIISQAANLHQWCLVFALLLCFGYVILCGYSVSATRALIMAMVWVACYLFAVRLKALQVLTVALTIVLIVDPFSLLNPGLYYSFFAVAIIVTLVTKVGRGLGAKLLALIKLQLALFICLLPLNLYFFSGASIISLVANIIVIPLVSIVVFPLLLLHVTALHAIGWQLPLHLVDNVLVVLFELLQKSPLSWVDIPGVSSMFLITSYLSALLLYLFRNYLGLLPILFFLVQYQFRASPLWQIDIFDVGHGTAVLVSRNNKGLLYDVGAKYFGYFSMFEFVIKPYLLNNRITLQDTIISHNDGDHNGGVDDLIAYDGGKSLQRFHPASPADSCVLGTHQFQGLDVSVIWPQEVSNNDNNNSCVVRISDGRFTLLLPGDIEKITETKLLNIEKEALKADILLVPHHGSGSSSSEQFIQAIDPDIAIFSRAFYSPWKIPNEKVIERYQRVGSTLLDTALDGHIKISIFAQEITVERAREVENYWFLR
ncbi:MULTISPECIES: DNA internalization-related competence protein ComEC/Rec2 [unclassified Pseudoalteromonas]|uniref:DNA internalization-related competence protein ComEC/Rec2 n=1 Tax=unclassified Pseudoalteromonas TaxID=194690 RepID=UPI001F1C2789|nr:MULTISPECIES: DNA internalization-related competence protein ComEC/Rec2 [unclassified Pseudoalteromonas]MCF2826523.1 DNA internalization-related competence protein ComEC/Rec2 [Pseudoalteromonas sp. OF5H-5]MCF2831847.1 DNA internalization-related competence protein ComEC/Rec2 [Pseudoalteromonas sp. DL2-H6]MCF2924742.1 DNA internalization-related competence protein ComEC/Rec2 [Pseudoalteromonas sp. DL2-H1]MCX2765607.1 DNA internalization-related competence protein ComEC/Rec2 [Pseudoalteromonas